MSEANMWKTLRKHFIAAELDPHRIESSTKSGIPDVNIVSGWIELKYIPRVPVRPDSKVRFPGFSIEQRNWLVKRSRSGGLCWVLVKVEKVGFFVFDGGYAGKRLGDLSVNEMMANCEWSGANPPSAEILKTIFALQ